MAGTEDNFVIQVDIDFRNAQQSVTRMVEVLARFNQEVDSPALRNAERNLAQYATGSSKVIDSANKAAESQKKLVQQMSTTRYAMFSAAAGLGIVSGALLSFNVATITAAASFDRAWANVTRTSDALRQSATLAANLREQFVKMSQELPIGFENLAAIGAMGNQLGVQTKDLAGFTKVVAEFSTVTGMSTDETATAFGRLDAILPGVNHNFIALGSSILKAGVTSVATEAQIVKTTVQLSAMGTMAGLTADEVVGLSAGFASIGVPPELARGTIVRLFSLMGKAVTQGGDSLSAFANVAGVSSSQFANSYGKAGFGDTFLKFMAGIALKGGDARQTLNDLGIKSVRDVPALLNLANAADSTGKSFGETAGKMGLLTQVFGAAADGFNSKTEIFKQYGIITQTVSAKLQILANNFQVFLAAIGESTSGPFSFLIDALTNVLKLMSSMATNPFGQAIFAAISVVTALAGALTGLGTVVALGFSGIIGMQQALAGLGAEAKGIGIAALVDQLGRIGGTSKVAAIAVQTLGVAFKVAMVAASAFAAVEIASFITKGIGDIMYSLQGLNTSFEGTLNRVKKNMGDIPKYFNLEGPAGLIAAQLNRGFAAFSGDTVMRDIAKVDEGLRNLAQNGASVTAAKELQTLTNQMLLQKVPLDNIKAQYTDAYKALYDLGYQVQVNKKGFVEIIAPTEAAAKAAGNMQTADELATQAADDLATSLNIMSTILNTPMDGELWSADIIKQFNKDFAKAAGGFIDYQAAMDAAQQKTAEGAAVAAGKGKDSWKDFVDTSKVDMGTFTQVLQDQITAQGSWITDIGTLAGKGADAFVQGLVQMGPKGAALAHAAVGMTTDELNKLEAQARIAAFFASAGFADEISKDFPVMKAVFTKGGSAALTAYTDAVVAGAPDAAATILANLGLDLTGAPIAVPVTADANTDAAKKKLDAFGNTPRSVNPLTADADPTKAGHTLDEFALRPRAVGPLKADADPTPAQHTLDQFALRPRAVGPLKADADPMPAAKTLDQFLNTTRWLSPLKSNADTGPATSTLNQFLTQKRVVPLTAEATNITPTETSLNYLARNRMVTFTVKTTGTTFTSDGGGFGGQGPLKQAAGGYISGPGTSTSDSIPAYLSNGEYVVKASAVRKVGVGYLDALNGGNAKLHSGNGYANGGYVTAGGTTGPVMVELSARDRSLLARIPDGLQIKIGNETISRANNAANLNSGTRGTN